MGVQDLVIGTICSALADSIKRHGGQADPCHLDMTDNRQVAEVVKKIHRKYRRMDIVIINADGNDAVNLRQSREAFENSLNKNMVH